MENIQPPLSVPPSTTGHTGEGQKNNGCGIPLIFAFIWIGSVVTISQAAIWFIEQGMMEGSINGDPGRWLIALVAGLAIVVPFGLLSLVKNEFYRHTFRTFALSGAAMVLLAPVRLFGITNSQAVSMAQLGGLALVATACLLIWRRRKSDQSEAVVVEGGYSLIAGITLALMAAIPWLLNGALGSWMDTLLGAAVGLMTAACAWTILRSGLLQAEGFDGNNRPLMKGFVISQTLLILGAALGVNGNEWILIILMPAAGWLAAGGLGGNFLFKKGFIWLVGGLTALPLIWVDSDELSLIITMGNGELFDWIIAATLITLVGLLVVTAFYLFTRGWFHRQKLNLKIGLISLAAIGILLGVLYFSLGHSGFYGERLFVILKEQGDLSGISEQMPAPDRRALVYRTLTAHAERTQAGLREQMQQLGFNFTSYYLVNAIEVEAGPLARLWLSLNPAVDRVLDSPHLRPLPAPIPVSTGETKAHTGTEWNLKLIQADKVWNELGVKGKGVIIGQSDSGVEGKHPEFASRYLGKDGSGDYTWLDPWNQTSSPADIGGHGTHTLGSILGETVGVAPEAGWIGCVNLARNLGNPAYYLDCMQFMLAPYPQKGDPFKDGNPSRGANILNNSWGCPEVEGCDALSLQPAVNALRKAGIFVVVSAGNSGENGCGSVDSPLAIYKDVYTVGAVNNQGRRAGFSSLGPVMVDGSRRVKPDILAPGAGVLSAFPGQSYNTLSGTSMAGPHVVGVVALMWSANPALIGNIDLTTQILNQTAKAYAFSDETCETSLGRPSNISGYGIVDAYAAVKLAISAPVK